MILLVSYFFNSSIALAAIAKSSFLNEYSSDLSVAGASDIPKARIWISKDEAWGVNNELDQTNSDLFNVLVHEIGHILGLDHSSDPNSMMYPLFERETDQVHPEVTSNDVEKLRNLYGNVFFNHVIIELN